MITFSFEEFYTENLGKILKPLAVVTLKHREHSLKDIMLIDSGADVTLIPRDRGLFLKLKPPKHSEIKYLGGIAGGVAVVYRTLDVVIEKVKFPCRAAWAMTEDVPSVLGRLDVFDKFNIEFRQRDRKVMFKER